MHRFARSARKIRGLTGQRLQTTLERVSVSRMHTHDLLAAAYVREINDDVPIEPSGRSNADQACPADW